MIFSGQEKTELYARLENEGEDAVRENLAQRIYGKDKEVLVREWLRRKEAKRRDTKDSKLVSAIERQKTEISLKIFEKKTPLWVTFLTLLLATCAGYNGCVANRRANEANLIAKSSLDISNEVHKTKDIPRLTVSPLGAQFYIPTNPEVPGQVKIDMSAIIENLSETPAREVALNFETKDWYGHKTSLFEIYKSANHPIPYILSLPKTSRMTYPSYAPDAPAGGLQGYLNQDKPFKLKLTLSWEDTNDKKYVYVGFYDLKSAPLPDGNYRLYFQPLSTYDSVKDGEAAWAYTQQEL